MLSPCGPHSPHLVLFSFRSLTHPLTPPPHPSRPLPSTSSRCLTQQAPFRPTKKSRCTSLTRSLARALFGTTVAFPFFHIRSQGSICVFSYIYFFLFFFLFVFFFVRCVPPSFFTVHGTPIALSLFSHVDNAETPKNHRFLDEYRRGVFATYKLKKSHFGLGI